MNAKNIAIQIMVISLPCHTRQCRFWEGYCATLCEDFSLNCIIILDLYGAWPSIDALPCARLRSFTLQESSANALFSAVLWGSQDSPVRGSDIICVVYECPTKDLTIELLGGIEVICMDLEMYDTITHIKRIKK